MKPEQLEKFGLTIGESKVYLALLKIGKSSTGKIIQEAQISNSKVYDILDRLSKKGLVGIVIENNVKKFEAKNPERLRESLREREKQIEENLKEFEKLLPSLKEIEKNESSLQIAEVLQGFSGIKNFTEKLLQEENEEIFMLGVTKQSCEKIDGYLIEWNKKRVSKKIPCKMIYNYDAGEYASKRKKLKFTEVKFFSKKMETPVTTVISKDSVTIILFSDIPLCFSIKNKEIAKRYKDFFLLMWEQAKTIK